MKSNPGHGSTVVEAAGKRVGVISLSGTVQLRAARSPFPEVEMLLIYLIVIAVLLWRPRGLFGAATA